jgi:beta-phosphoglucomutase
MIQAILFDLDGLLIDSESLHFSAWRRTFGSIGFELSEELYLSHWTRAGMGVADFCRLYKLSTDADALRGRKAALYRDLILTELQLMPGARQCLETFRGHKRMALATAGYLEAVDPALERFELRDYFEAIVTRNDVKRFKPAPDVFLRAAELLNLPPAHCVVLEDAEKGVVAAHAAGMACIAIPTRHTKDNDFSLASRVVSSLHEVTLALLESL